MLDICFGKLDALVAASILAASQDMFEELDAGWAADSPKIRDLKFEAIRLYGSLEGIERLWQRAGVNPNKFKQLLQASPFRPIKICTGSNKTYSIPHPEFTAPSPEGETLIVFLPGRGGHDVVNVPQIERVEVRKKSPARS